MKCPYCSSDVEKMRTGNTGKKNELYVREGDKTFDSAISLYRCTADHKHVFYCDDLAKNLAEGLPRMYGVDEEAEDNEIDKDFEEIIAEVNEELKDSGVYVLSPLEKAEADRKAQAEKQPTWYEQWLEKSKQNDPDSASK